jgi:hypothetical protein
MSFFGGSITTPEDRQGLERSIAFVFEHTLRAFESGDEQRIGSAMIFTVGGLEEIQTLPNGRLDMNSVEKPIRLQGNTLVTMDEKRDRD